jgi:DNA-binding response OmpR family regulator
MSRVLIVDDAIDLGRLLQTSLTMLHPTPDSAVVPSAEEAILEARREKVDLLVTDLRLPGMTGQELTDKIRARHPQVKVIMITGMTDDLVLQKAEAQSDVLLRKPMEIQDFLSAVRKCLNVEESRTPIPLTVSAEKPEKRVAVKLADIRKSIKAVTALLLDHNGRVIAQSGDLPDIDFESKLGQLLVTAIGYGLKVSLLLGKTAPENVMAFHGENYHLVLAPVGDYVLALAADSKRSNHFLSRVIDDVLQAQKELSLLLSEMEPTRKQPEVKAENATATTTSSALVENIEPLPVMAEEINEPEEDTAAFEALFSSSTKKKALTENPDDFWNSAAASHRFGPGSPNRLTFEEARQLGLTPDK